MRGRTVGLSRKARPDRLLKTLPQDQTLTDEPLEKSKRGGGSKTETMDEEDISALPKDSDDEIESDSSETPPAKERAKRTLRDTIEDSDDSGDGMSTKGDIRITEFVKKPAVSSQEDPSWLRRMEGRSGGGAKAKKTYGKEARKTYGKGSKGAVTTAAKEARGVGQPVKGSKQPNEVLPERLPKKRKRGVEDVKEKAQPVKLSLPDDWHVSSEGEVQKKGNGSNASDEDDTPGKAPALRIISTSPPAKTKSTARLNTRVLGSVSPVKQSGRRSARLRSLTMSPEAVTKRTRITRSPSRSPTTKAPDNDLDHASSSLSDSPNDTQPQEAARCPYCDETVDHDLLQKFTAAKAGGGRLNLRQQRIFCTEHKKHKARAFWELHAYPSPIDWAALPGRIAASEAHLESVLRGQSPSHFAGLLAVDVKAGTKRNLLKADFNTTPGYYGPRGFRVMQEAVFARFSPLLKERAIVDPLISGRSYSLYVQTVLVPELATRLVVDDLGVDEETARKVLEESAWVGELLCEDIGDVVDSDAEGDGL